MWACVNYSSERYFEFGILLEISTDNKSKDIHKRLKYESKSLWIVKVAFITSGCLMTIYKSDYCKFGAQYFRI